MISCVGLEFSAVLWSIAPLRGNVFKEASGPDSMLSVTMDTVPSIVIALIYSKLSETNLSMSIGQDIESSSLYPQVIKFMSIYTHQ